MRIALAGFGCLLWLGLCGAPHAGAQSGAAAKGSAMEHKAHGAFEVKVQPLASPGLDGVSRFSIDKTIHGDLEATTRGEMYAAGDLKAGTAGYVAIETVTGTLAGKSGSFVLQHFATMDASGLSMTVKVVPGSGTGELKGIAGTFVITIAEGKHTYDLEYTLPGS